MTSEASPGRVTTAHVLPSVLDAIGSTPLIHLQRFCPEGRIHLKAEHLNPGGSHKVRIAHNMITSFEDQGVLTRGSGQTILEPTGGNTGVGIAMCCAVLGYQCVLVVPDNYSRAKQSLLRAYGASVVLSDSSRGNNSHGERAMELQFEHPDWVMLNQGANTANPEVHRRVTAQEILGQFGADVPAAMVAGIGTGGHISGVGAVLREAYPGIRIFGVQPAGCSVDDDVYVRHRIQGLSIGYKPPNFDRELVDRMVTVEEDSAIAATRELMRTEGIGAGISTGANLHACRELVESGVAGPVLTFSYDNVTDYVDELG